ncbi:MAG TPA: hypothetical protein VGH62_02765 [Bradyrhizobium sp.]
MSNRTAKFVSAIFVSVLAGALLTTVSHGAVPADDDCLSGPKGQTPSGGHWYYRVDRSTKRHCWYLGDEKEKLSRVAPKDSAPLADAVSPRKETPTQRSIADAHAELPWPQTRLEQETNVTPGQPNPATAMNAASVENNERANTQDVNTRVSVIASRWPEQSGASSSTGPEPTTGNSGATVQSNSEAAPSPAVAEVTLAAADASSEKKPGSIQMLLIIIAGALTFAGLIGSAVFRFGRMRQAGPREIRSDRRPIWDLADTDRPSPTAYPRAEVSMRRVDIPRELREADDPSDRIAEMLARLSRTAAN